MASLTHFSTHAHTHTCTHTHQAFEARAGDTVGDLPLGHTDTPWLMLHDYVLSTQPRAWMS